MLKILAYSVLNWTGRHGIQQLTRQKKTILSLDRSDNSMVFHGISMVYAMYLGNYSKWLKAGGTVFPLAAEFPR